MSLTPHEQLLSAIKSRQTKNTEFNGGILTADRYLKTLQDCAGSDLCYRYAAKGNLSFDDQIKRAKETLTYNNPDMIVEDNYSDWKKDFSAKDIYEQDIELPKNTLMVFKHVLTSPRKDRDGDVLRTQGARPDPNMLLLWQHTHTLPIGKMLAVAEHTKNKLSLVSALVDVNDLAHDSAVMIENKMGRFSHGFKALDFSDNKEIDKNGKSVSTGGFDIKVFEIMEESLVSVPSNVDAEVTDVLLTLVGNGKLTSPLMKSFGTSLKSKQNATVNVPVDLKSLPITLNVTVNTKSTEKEDEDESIKSAGKSTKCGCGCNGAPGGCGKQSTPEKADANDGEEKSTEQQKEKSVNCPECGASMKEGACTKCNYREKSSVDGISAKEAMAIFLSKATKEEIDFMEETVKKLQEIRVKSERGRKFASLLNRK